MTAYINVSPSLRIPCSHCAEFAVRVKVEAEEKVSEIVEAQCELHAKD